MIKSKQNLNLIKNNLFHYVWDEHPLMNEKDIRAVLGRFLFVQDDVKKIIIIVLWW